ncbi:hypothetical protein E1B28_010489 [Marasmius oreades]|uniref:Uncharacterized protein n=1 Tax=Marasmius oreades TaxID=181124 RepID=A0A9P7RXD1_9AGAR|nr:uncharacterized protein E1B28_010489 [Marasmius oreades]KAG7091455.1 hypothetical protein E1B28_010489 [Marasmius oreades]
MRLSARERDLQSQDNIDVESPQAHHQLISKPSPSPPQTKARFVLKTLLHVLVACFFRFSAIVFGTLESCVFGRRVWMSRVRRDQSILRAIRDAGIGLRRMRWRESVRCTVYHQSDMQRYFTPKGTQRRQVINVRSVDQVRSSKLISLYLMTELLGTPPTPPLPKFTITSWPFDFVALSVAVDETPTQSAADFQATVTRL